MNACRIALRGVSSHALAVYPHDVVVVTNGAAPPIISSDQHELPTGVPFAIQSIQLPGPMFTIPCGGQLWAATLAVEKGDVIRPDGVAPRTSAQQIIIQTMLRLLVTLALNNLNILGLLLLELRPQAASGWSDEI